MTGSQTGRAMPFPKGKYFVSRTDIQGNIIDFNDAFVEASGYTEEELLNANHRIFRHPDMPDQVFVQMWESIKRGRPWVGIVKNRVRNGDYYWARAEVVPITRDRSVIGYMSVRAEPSIEDVKAAEKLYAELRANPQKKMPRRSKFFERISLRSRLLAIIAVMMFSVIVGTIWSLIALKQTHALLEEAHAKQFAPISAVGEMLIMLGDNRSILGQALIDHATMTPEDFAIALQKHINGISKNRDDIDQVVKRLQAMPLEPEARRLVDEVILHRTTFVRDGLNPAYDALRAQQIAQAGQILRDKAHPLYRKVIEAHDRIKVDLEKHALNSLAESEARYQSLFYISLLCSIASIAVVGAMSFWMYRRLRRGFATMSFVLSGIAEGDLSRTYRDDGADEISTLLENLLVTQTRQKEIIARITSASQHINGQSAELREHMEHVVSQSSGQMQSAQSVAASTEELSQTIEAVSSNAQKAAEAAGHARELVQESGRTIQHSMTVTEQVMNAVIESGKTITELHHSIEQIGNITQTIRGISEQTNLLALNAAIEAARAGEVGRGFAVVADEVRTLAERTGSSTTDISSMVDNIQAITRRVVNSMNIAVSEVETGMQEMRASVASLDQVEVAASDVAVQAEEIASASLQQAEASRHVAQQIDTMSSLSQENHHAANEATASCQELDLTANKLHEVVREFRVV